MKKQFSHTRAALNTSGRAKATSYHCTTMNTTVSTLLGRSAVKTLRRLTTLLLFAMCATGLWAQQPWFNAFEIIHGSFIFKEAKADAESRGGHLATFHSDDEYNEVLGLLITSPNVWLGGYQLPGSAEPSGGWTWVTGEPWNYTRWSGGEPNNDHGGVENALMTWNNATWWNDAYEGDKGAGWGVSYLIEYENGLPKLAAAQAIISAGFCVSANLTTGGSGYTAVPMVTISGGGGSGATAYATLSGDQVSGISITSPGQGYTTTPKIAFAPPAMPNYNASGYATVENGFLTSCSLTNRGYGYVSPPSVNLIGGGGLGATAIAEVTNGVVRAIIITHPGSGYTSAPTVIVGPPVVPTLSVEFSKIRVRINATLGAKYQLESSSDFQSWVAASEPFVSIASQYSLEFDIHAVGRFFRLKQVP